YYSPKSGTGDDRQHCGQFAHRDRAGHSRNRLVIGEAHPDSRGQDLYDPCGCRERSQHAAVGTTEHDHQFHVIWPHYDGNRIANGHDQRARGLLVSSGVRMRIKKTVLASTMLGGVVAGGYFFTATLTETPKSPFGVPKLVSIEEIGG